MFERSATTPRHGRGHGPKVAALARRGAKIKEVPVLVRNSERDIGTSDVPYLKTFQSSNRHTDVTAYDFIERWGISLSQSNITLKNNTQKSLHGAVLLLSRRNHMDIVFTIKTLQVQWSCDTINRRFKSMDDNQNTQVFANKD